MRPDDDPRTIKELGFKAWFTDVLWYHYKWVILGSLAVLVAAGAIAMQFFSKTETDAEIVLAVSKTISPEKVNDLKFVIGGILGDVNGDGEILISINQFLLNPDEDEKTYNPSFSTDSSAMLATFLRPNIVLYLFDRVNLEIYAPLGNERFNADVAAEYGGSNGVVPLGDVELFKQLDLTGEDELYACFKVKTLNVKKNDEEYYQTARKIMDGFFAVNG
jgi:hypothetical protein